MDSLFVKISKNYGISVKQEQIIEWWKEYGAQRQGREKIKLDWLDDVLGILDRQNEILKRRKENRACVALWGMSQSGKSTTLSKYIDGEGDKTSTDSAQNWGTQRVRFSGDAGHFKGQDVVIFNPFNAGTDGSALATKYYLPEDESIVNIEFPVTLSIGTRREVLHALSIGYWSTARLPNKNSITAEAWNRQTEDNTAQLRSTLPDFKAFGLLRDVCDVCSLLGKTMSSGQYDDYTVNEGNLRKQALNAPSLNSSYERALGFAAQVLWQNNERQTRFFIKMMDVREKFQGKVLLATMKAAARQEDFSAIDPGKVDVDSNIYYREQGNTIFFSDKPEGTLLDEKTFGYFQALVGEMCIPLKDRSDRISDQDFFKFMKKHDLLDIPGVTNDPQNSVKSEDAQLYLDESTPDFDIFKRQYKMGKTLSLVYGQMSQFSIDSFLLLVRILDRAPRNPKAIDDGVKAWLTPYADGPINFTSGRTPLKFFIDISCMGKAWEEICQSSGATYKSFVSNQTCSQCADYFFTAQSFAKVPNDNDPVKNDYLFNSTDFQNAFFKGNTGKKSLEEQISDGTGSNFMFRYLNDAITTEARFRQYDRIDERDQAALVKLIFDHLPNTTDDTKARLKTCLQKVRKCIEYICGSSDDEKIQNLAILIKSLVSVESDNLENIIFSPADQKDSLLKAHIEQQFEIWKQNKEKMLVELSETKGLLGIDSSDTKTFCDLLALLDKVCERDQMDALKNDFQYVNTETESRTAKHYFALLMNNVLWSGKVERTEIDSAETVEDFVLLPFRRHLDDLAVIIDNMTDVNGRLDQPGDAELQRIADNLELVKA